MFFCSRWISRAENSNFDRELKEVTKKVDQEEIIN